MSLTNTSEIRRDYEDPLQGLEPGLCSPATLAQANEIIEEYMDAGYELTLRQLYYQFVARGLLPNTERSYKNLGVIINKGRLAGYIDWMAIVDRTRGVESNAHWETPEDIIQAAANAFALDKWDGQPFRPEVWVEKEALAGVVAKAANELDVPYLSCRGYTSQSEMWIAARRLRAWHREKARPVIIYLGDHDPSGIDMSRDITDRQELFGAPVKFVRLALNIDQVEEHNPPPNPTKITDSRAGGYIQRFGYESWELDALDPKVLDQLIRDKVLEFRDEEKWNKRVELEQEHREFLDLLPDNWEEVKELLQSKREDEDDSEELEEED